MSSRKISVHVMTQPLTTTAHRRPAQFNLSFFRRFECRQLMARPWVAWISRLRLQRSSNSQRPISNPEAMECAQLKEGSEITR
ncbi:hypothetical protein RRG08_060810 [Elysia crispata]|uniref:Uncharacterized protein n=1 Tax=Elysia crispata TaxID=231223 RepID=A0AAE0YVQ1_9GAST|nr:hypothetical protein RRG08_060810 [Elysia crispata]